MSECWGNTPVTWWPRANNPFPTEWRGWQCWCPWLVTFSNYVLLNLIFDLVQNRYSFEHWHYSNFSLTTHQKTFLVSNERYVQNKTFLLQCYGIDFAPIKRYSPFVFYVLLSAFLSVCFFFSLSFLLSVCPSFCLSVHHYVFPSVCPFFCLSFCLSFFLSFFLSV